MYELVAATVTLPGMYLVTRTPIVSNGNNVRMHVHARTNSRYELCSHDVIKDLVSFLCTRGRPPQVVDLILACCAGIENVTTGHLQ